MGICPWYKGKGDDFVKIVIHSTRPVPLYLLPQTLSEEIRKYGDSITGMLIHRTSGHSYIIKIRRNPRGDRS